MNYLAFDTSGTHLTVIANGKKRLLKAWASAFTLTPSS